MTNVNPVHLRPFTAADEQAARVARRAFMGTDFAFLSDFRDDDPWAVWTDRMDRYYRGEGLPADWVRAAHLAAEANGELVGAVSIRLALNDYLAARGGHIGYGVLPEHRGRGHATSILQQAVAFARREGVNQVLVTCADSNVASIRVIDKCGGMLESVQGSGGAAFRRYWL